MSSSSVKPAAATTSLPGNWHAIHEVSRVIRTQWTLLLQRGNVPPAVQGWIRLCLVVFRESKSHTQSTEKLISTYLLKILPMWRREINDTDTDTNQPNLISIETCSRIVQILAQQMGQCKNHILMTWITTCVQQYPELWLIALHQTCENAILYEKSVVAAAAATTREESMSPRPTHHRLT